MDDVLQEQIRYYRERAGEYDDFWYRRGSFGLTGDDARRWWSDAEETMQWLRGLGIAGRVLEPACGTGIFTSAIVADAEAVTAVDSSPEVIDLNAARLRDGRVSYVVADLFDWTPAPSSYDWVVFTYWLSHVPDGRFAAFWGTVRNALAPGGRVALVDSRPYAGVSSPPAAAPSTYERRRLSDGQEFTVVKRYWSPAELTAALAALGWDAEVRVTGHDMVLLGSARPVTTP